MRKVPLFLLCLLCFSLLAGCTAAPGVSDLPADSAPVATTDGVSVPAATTDPVVTTAGEVATGTSDATKSSASQTTTAHGVGTTATSAPTGMTTVAVTTGDSTGTSIAAGEPLGATTVTGHPVTSTTAATQKVLLPQAGHDADGKGRILLESATLEGNTVTLVFKNHSTSWVTDEDSYFTYVCTDATGKELLRDTLYCGAISAGKQRTCQLALPAATARLELVDFTTTYWTEWKK